MVNQIVGGAPFNYGMDTHIVGNFPYEASFVNILSVIFLCKKSDENENQFGAKPSNMFVTIDG